MAAAEFSTSVVTEGDVDNVMSLLRRTFYVDEPLNAAVGLCTDSPCTDLDDYCKRSLLNGLCFKAVDKDANIIGITISAITPLKETNEESSIENIAKNCKDPKFQKVLYILANRIEKAKLWEKYPNDVNCVEVAVAATDPNWRKRGIMNRLVAETEKVCKERGIRLIRIDTSSFYSAKSAERNGFTKVWSQPYTEIIRNGQPLIIPAPPHVDDRIYMKTLFDL